MQKFKPLRSSWVSRINAQTAILFFVAVATIGASLYYLRTNQTNLNLTRGGSFAVKSSRLQQTEAGTTFSNEASDENPEGTAFVEGQAGRNRENGQVQIAVQDQAQLESLAGRNVEGNSKSAQAEFQNPRIKISFVEISQDQLNQLLADIQNEGMLQRDNESFKGIINNVTQLSQYTYKTLKQDVKDIKPDQIEAFFYGRTVRESSQFMGLQVNLEKKSAGSEEARWTLTANKVLPNEKQSELHEFQIQNNSALFLNARHWIDGFQNDRSLSDVAPFQIFKSPDFLNQRSEILILLEFY